MTLEQAVVVLNRERHRSEHQWFTTILPVGCQGIRTPDGGNEIDEFEAIAIAEKYEREKPADAEPPKSKAEQVAHKLWLATIGRQHGIYR